VLKEQQHKRYRVAEYLHNILVKTTFENLAIITNDSILLGIGYPKNLREHKGRKNITIQSSLRQHRKRIHHWSFKTLIDKLQLKALEFNHFPTTVVEYLTTKRCHRCGRYDALIKAR
jgi:transposase